ncbi:FmdB family zinc ribbon protein [Thermomonas sp.]
MPIYAFACDACHHTFDRLQKLSDADPTDCPACSAAAIRRQLTAPQFRLAGSGWYETDFKKDGDKQRNLAGDGSDAGKSAADAKTAGSPESKPAAGAKPVAAPAPAAAPVTPAAKPDAG